MSVAKITTNTGNDPDISYTLYDNVKDRFSRAWVAETGINIR